VTLCGGVRSCGGRASFVSLLYNIQLSMTVSAVVDCIRRDVYSGYFKSLFSVYILYRWSEIVVVVSFSLFGFFVSELCGMNVTCYLSRKKYYISVIRKSQVIFFIVVES